MFRVQPCIIIPVLTGSGVTGPVYPVNCLSSFTNYCKHFPISVGYFHMTGLAFEKMFSKLHSDKQATPWKEASSNTTPWPKYWWSSSYVKPCLTRTLLLEKIIIGAETRMWVESGKNWVSNISTVPSATVFPLQWATFRVPCIICMLCIQNWMTWAWGLLI